VIETVCCVAVFRTEHRLTDRQRSPICGLEAHREVVKNKYVLRDDRFSLSQN
jgi:hypothetical protein